MINKKILMELSKCLEEKEVNILGIIKLEEKEAKKIATKVEHIIARLIDPDEVMKAVVKYSPDIKEHNKEFLIGLIIGRYFEASSRSWTKYKEKFDIQIINKEESKFNYIG